MSNTEALRAAAQQALDAMNYSGMDVGKFNRINAACRALREALTASTHPADVSKSGAETNITAASGEPAGLAVWLAPGRCPTPRACEHNGKCHGKCAAPQPAPVRVPLTDERLNAAGLDYALADSFSSGKAEWVAQDIADAFKAGARAAERYYAAPTAQQEPKP